MGTKAYQAIGQVLRINPDAPRIPCHRVVSSDGSLGGFMGDKTDKTLNKKIALLKSEGVFIEQGMIANFDQLFFDDF
jgi:O6-methylguanine-DNA--protein-cysteine methyltransferase